MTFRQPERQQQLRILSHDDDARGVSQTAPRQVLPPVAELQTRIIFSPAADATTTASSYVVPSHRTTSTLGRSRFSDLGSLQSVIVRSADDDELLLSATFSEVNEDDAELDSLDGHLPEFWAGSSHLNTIPHSNSTPVLPTHDGLGSFRLDHSAVGHTLQEQLYAFEQFNPRRIKRRRESLELAQHELECDDARDAEKVRRIEEWRLEQGRYLLQEVEKETRRRGLTDAVPQYLENIGVGQQSAPHAEIGLNAASKDTDWHEHDDPVGPKKKEVTWTQTIKSVIKEIISVDDKILSVLFGEALPDEEDDLSSKPKASLGAQNMMNAATRPDHAWQDRILARIARELGLLMHRLSDHPGAFSTYVRMQQMPLPYAGLPVIPEATYTEQPTGSAGSITSIQFQPTIKQVAQPVEIPGTRQLSAAPDMASTAHDDWGWTFTQQEWEQELDVKMVFRYLRARFASQPPASSPPVASSAMGVLSTQDTAAKAARVRLHHPLVSRSRPAERRTFKATRPSSPIALRHASNCASQSTRRSARRGSGSSRPYWDIGGSVGTGSIITSTGHMGGWGDV